MSESPLSLDLLLADVGVDRRLLRRALTHRSITQENASLSNERLEFLGDSVLSVVVTEHLYRAFPDFDEGRLSKLRAALVGAVSLADVGRALGIGDAVDLSTAEETAGGRLKSSIIADAYEALVGAVFLSGGLDAARGFVMQTLGPRIDALASDRIMGDFKSALQEYLARVGLEPPTYLDTWSGPDHERWFESVVLVGARELAAGSGRSKKFAQQIAAERALAELHVSET